MSICANRFLQKPWFYNRRSNPKFNIPHVPIYEETATKTLYLFIHLNLSFIKKYPKTIRAQSRLWVETNFRRGLAGHQMEP